MRTESPELVLTHDAGHRAIAGLHRTRVLLSLAAVYLIWSSGYLATRIALTGIAPLLLVGVRYLIAGAILYAGLRLSGVASPTRREWVGSARIALLMIVVTSGCNAMAQQHVDSGLAALAFGTTPLWAALFATLWERSPSRPEKIGLAIGFAGIVLMNAQGGLHTHPLWAVVLFSASFAWAFGSMLSRHATLPPGAMAGAAQMLTGGAILLTIGILIDEPVGLPGLHPAAALLYLAIFSSLVGFSAYTYLIHHTSPALATSHAYVNPAIAILLGAIVESEPVGKLEIAAMVLTAASVFLLMQGRGYRELHARLTRQSKP